MPRPPRRRRRTRIGDVSVEKALESQFLKLYPSHCEGSGCWKPGDPEPPEPNPSGDDTFDQAEEMMLRAEVVRAVQWRRMERKASCGRNQAFAFVLAVAIGATWSPMKGRRR